MKILLVGAAAALALCCAACSSSTADTTAANSSGSKGSAGTLTIVVAGNGGLDYDPQLNALPSATGYMSPVFDTLLNENTQGVISPGLATAWKFSGNGLALTLTLRPGVKFQDGTPLNAAAVKANILRGQTDKESVIANQLTSISSVDAVNPTTVVLHLKSPGGALLGYFSGSAGMMASPASWANKNDETHPVGAGPWEVSSASVPGSDMIYTAFKGYWDPAVQKVAAIHIVVSAESTFVPSMTSGSANTALLTGAATDGKTLGTDGFPVKSSNVTFLQIMYFNKTGIFASPLVRQAVSMAINRQELCTALFADSAACTPTGQPVAPSSWAYDRSLAPPKQNIAEARTLLKQAGHPNGISFTATVAATYGEGETQLTAIQSMLAQAGIHMTIRALPIPQLFPALDSGSVQAYYGPDTGGADPAIPLETDLSSAYDPGNYSVPQLTQLLSQANAVTNPAARPAAYQKVSAEYQASAFNVVTLNQNLQFATAKNVNGVTVHDPLVVEARGATVSP
jgi:peptide/nickel transport system substrate-binding protein